MPNQLDTDRAHHLNLVANEPPNTLQHQGLESKLHSGNLLRLLDGIVQGQHVAVTIKCKTMLFLDLFDASRASAIPNMALVTLEIAQGTLLTGPASWALAHFAHRIRCSKFAGQFALVAPQRAPVSHTLALAAIFESHAIDADQATHVAITPLPR